MTGGTASFARTGGTHWLWNMSTNIESPEFEMNDVGRLMAADGVTGRRDSYRETQPGRWLRNYSLQLEKFDEWNYAGDRQSKVVPQGQRFS